MEQDSPIVVRSERAEVIIEPLRIRHPLDDRFPIGDIPLANARGLITCPSDQLSEGDLRSRHAPPFAANRLPTGQQS